MVLEAFLKKQEEGKKPSCIIVMIIVITLSIKKKDFPVKALK